MKIAKLLLEKASNVNAKDRHGCTPLMRAAEHGHAEMAKVLIAHGANAGLMDNYGTKAIGWARSRSKYSVLSNKRINTANNI